MDQSARRHQARAHAGDFRMFNPNTAPYYDRFIRSYKGNAGAFSVEVGGAHIQSVADIERAIAELARDPGGGLITPGDPYILTTRGAILRRRPSARGAGEFALQAIRRRRQPDVAMGPIPPTSSGAHVRISIAFSGESPVGNLPAQSPDKFELVVNLKSAKALGLSVRQPFLLLADEVIE